MTTIIVARHGSVHNPDNTVYPPDTELSADGVAQMQSLGKILAKRPIDIILASPFVRTLTSANLIQKELPNHPEVRQIEGFAGVNTPGWYGRSMKELEDAGPLDAWAHPEWCDESPAEVLARFKKTFDEIIENKEYEGKTILVVSHTMELGILENELMHPGSEPKIQQFSAPRGEALQIQVDDEGKIISSKMINSHSNEV